MTIFGIVGAGFELFVSKHSEAFLVVLYLVVLGIGAFFLFTGSKNTN